MKRFGLLPRIVVAIILGLLVGSVLPEVWVRLFVTFNYVFSQFLGFLIPLIIIGLVTPAIANIGRAASKLLLLTVEAVVAAEAEFFAISSFASACLTARLDLALLLLSTVALWTLTPEDEEELASSFFSSSMLMTDLAVPIFKYLF